MTQVKAPMEFIKLSWFTREAQIAAWYAKQAKAKIMFATPGILCRVAGCGNFGYPRGYRKNKWDKMLLDQLIFID